MSAVLSAKNLSVAVSGGIDVLRDIGFDLMPGRVLGLVGESGAGKSMLGRVISRNLPQGFDVSAGSLHFQDKDLLTIPTADRLALLGDRIAFIPQEPMTALNPVLTIRQQFDEHLSRLGVAKAERQRLIIAALSEVRLRDPEQLLDRYPFQLSGGMCQRVLIAMAFVSRPALVIADEPTTALDVSTQQQVVRIIRDMQASHRTAMLFITHDLRLASHVCDEIMVLYAGDVVERGPGADVMREPFHPYTRALIRANPSPDGPLRRLVTLPSQMPGIRHFAGIRGCRFAPRCALRTADCETAPPPLAATAPDHFARCIHLGASASLNAELEPSTLRARLRPMDDATPLLELSHVAKVYQGQRDWRGRRGKDFTAVREATLQVRSGEFVGIVGESGSGKSTIAKLAMGIETPTAGAITIAGKHVDSASTETRLIRLETLQMVFQDPQSALNPRRTVERLITQALEAPGHATDRSSRHERAESLVKETGLNSDLLPRYPSQLSGGQKQRVNIARALCVTPKLLVADEIVSGLDVSVQAQILNLLLDLRESRGIGLLFISHDLAVVRYLCDRVLVMNRGEIVEEGDVEAVFRSPQHPYTRSLMAATPPDDPTVPWPAAAADA